MDFDLEERMRKIAEATIEKMTTDLFDLGKVEGDVNLDGYTDTASADDQEPLTFDKLLEIKMSLKKPDLYYATTDFIEEGRAISVEKMEFNPRFLVCHPEDFDYLKGRLEGWFNLIPLTSYRLTAEQEAAGFEALGKMVSKEADKFRWRLR